MDNKDLLLMNKCFYTHLSSCYGTKKRLVNLKFVSILNHLEFNAMHSLSIDNKLDK